MNRPLTPPYVPFGIRRFNLKLNMVTIQSPREFNNYERKRVEEKNREFVNLQ